MTNLAGIHDREGQAIAPPGTWVVDTVALSGGPIPTAYSPDFNWIARLNWGYGSTGTLPLPEQYGKFAQSAAGYVAGCSGCSRWIIGNEPSLPREWANGQPIFPWDYAACYKLCRQAIHALPGHGNDEVLIAASGPWNDELKYSTNPNGDWITYFADVIQLLNGEFDGCALHSYTHGYDVSLVTSTAKMDAPFQNRFYNFRTYQDYIRAIPEAFWHLPIYITEANGNGPWKAVGLMPAMLAEIDGWNAMVNGGRLPPIRSVIFYRYPHYDDFYIEGRDDCVAEYRAAVAKGYQSPMPIQPAPQPPQPTPPTPTPPAPHAQRDIDPRLIARGVRFDFATPPAGTGYWRITKAQWLNEQEADAAGPDHHIIGEIVRDGAKVVGVPFLVEWPSDSTHVVSKNDSGAIFNYDYPMSKSLNEFSIRVDDGNPTDKASGIGMGANGNPALHTSTWIDWEWASAGNVEPGPTPPDPTPTPPDPTPTPPTPSPAGALIWPVQGPITQFFGPHGIDYPGSVGHDGIDFGVPEGTPVLAVADGKVMYVDNDPAGFGLYVRIFHPAHGFHAFFGHLSKQLVTPGQMVKQGQPVALSGNTGNSTGPHLHYSTRLGSENAYYDLHDGYHSGCANPLAVYALVNHRQPI